MGKKAIGARLILYPLPVVIVGTQVDNRPNFSTYSWCGIVNSDPPMISVSFFRKRYTLEGVKQNGAFSVNIPPAGLVTEADYCGLVSGRDNDKAADCNFTVFYGKLVNAPMIDECPVNLECRVIHILSLGSHEMVVGQIEEVFITDSCLTDGEPDFEKIQPFLLVVHPARQYRTFGKFIGNAFSIGNKLKDRR